MKQFTASFGVKVSLLTSSVTSVAFINGASTVVFLCRSFVRPKRVCINMSLL